MKYRGALVVFALALVSDMWLLLSNEPGLRYISKPSIVLALLFFLVMNVRSTATRNTGLPLAALLFSLLGDILLLFESTSDVFFLLGLSAFLLAHFFYIFAFNSIRKQERIHFKAVFFIPVFIYYAALLLILYPRLGEMKLPVLVYGAVICTMLVMSLHLKTMKDQKAGTCFLGGAVLFVISDSLLAFNKFHTAFENAGVWIMGTYGLAQMLLVLGFGQVGRLSGSIKNLNR